MLVDRDVDQLEGELGEHRELLAERRLGAGKPRELEDPLPVNLVGEVVPSLAHGLDGLRSHGGEPVLHEAPMLVHADAVIGSASDADKAAGDSANHATAAPARASSDAPV